MTLAEVDTVVAPAINHLLLLVVVMCLWLKETQAVLLDKGLSLQTHGLSSTLQLSG